MADVRVHMLLERVSNVLREDLRAVATAHGLALTQLEALHYFAVANRYSDTLSGLVDFLGATKGTVSQTISALVRKGLLRRVRDESDGRLQHCQLTPAGRAIVTESLPAPALRGLENTPIKGDTEALLEALLRSLLSARGGVAFGVCRTCMHYQKRVEGGFCGLLKAPLSEAESELWCREHAAAS